jgi:hypothetical protein
VSRSDPSAGRGADPVTPGDLSLLRARAAHTRSRSRALVADALEVMEVARAVTEVSRDLGGRARPA